MQSRVLDGEHLLGWEKRQPVREDGSAERGKQHRELEKLRAEIARLTNEQTQPNATERKQTLEKSREDKEQIKVKPTAQNPAGFARFWAAYPKKKSKGDAEKAFKSIKPSEQVLEAILQAITRAMTSVEWAKDGGQFIPYPGTWLRAKGWEDEITGVVLAPDGTAKPWWESASGIAAKGKELGLEQTEAVFAVFRDRVFAAAGQGPWNKGRP
jgi:hypothetical protein